MSFHVTNNATGPFSAMRAALDALCPIAERGAADLSEIAASESDGPSHAELQQQADEAWTDLENARALLATPAPLIAMQPDLEAKIAELAPPDFDGRHPLAQALADLLEATCGRRTAAWTRARKAMDLIRDAEDTERRRAQA